jgi:protein-disulfide isomerase-like protein with CxxC motif
MRRFGARGVPTLVAGEGTGAAIDSGVLHGQVDVLIDTLRAS